MLKQSHYKVGCDAHKHYSLFAVFDRQGKPVKRTRVNHEPGGIRAYPLPLPARHARRPGNRGQPSIRG